MSELVNPRDRSSANVFDAATSPINSENTILIIASPHGVIARDDVPRTQQQESEKACAHVLGRWSSNE
jgi:hypothetical protein